MPTTTKGLPFPLSTAPPNVPADIQALAQDLDFTKIQVLPASSGLTNASFLDAWPMGVTSLVLFTADGSAGGWPSGGSSHVWTFKPNTSRGFQLCAHTGISKVFYRSLAPSPGPHLPWVVVVDGSGVWTAIPAASGHTSNAFSRVEPDGVTVRLKGYFTKTAPPLVRATTLGTITTAHRPLEGSRFSTGLGNAASGPGTSGLVIGTDGTLQLTSDATSLGSQAVAFVDGISYSIAP